CLQFLKSRGAGPQLVAPELGFHASDPYAGAIGWLGDPLAKLAAVARQFNTPLRIHHGEAKQREVVEATGKATERRGDYGVAVDSQVGDSADAKVEEIPWIAECLFA